MSVHWNTPVRIAVLVDEFFQGIDLDPCSNDHSVVVANYCAKLPECGLELKWEGFGKIFVNPHMEEV